MYAQGVLVVTFELIPGYANLAALRSKMSTLRPSTRQILPNHVTCMILIEADHESV